MLSRSALSRCVQQHSSYACSMRQRTTHAACFDLALSQQQQLLKPLC
jgi:hypothetical protein